MSNSQELQTVRLTAPVDDQQLQSLTLGTIVFIDGLIYTAREGVYKKVVEANQKIPVRDLALLSNINFHCSPAAAQQPDGSYRIGAVTATASFRFANWLARWFELAQPKIVIGKGGMSPSAYRDHFVPNGAVYLTTVGYGTGALLGRGVKQVRNVYCLEELGIAQALWILEVENFGPFIVESDLGGNSLFEQENRKIAANLSQVYTGTRPAILSRFGETHDPTDELI